MSRVRASRPELRFLTEAELGRTVALAGDFGPLISVGVGTGARFGELTALWVSDVDLANRTLRINKAWKRTGEDGASEIPGWLGRKLGNKHRMREHYLGNPKTPRSRRTITISPAVVQVLAEQIEGKAADDFDFTNRSGLPLHNSDFYVQVWKPLM